MVKREMVALTSVGLRCEVAKTDVERVRMLIMTELTKGLDAGADPAWRLSRPGTYIGPRGTRLVFQDDPGAEDNLYCDLNINRSFLTHIKPGQESDLFARLVRQHRMRCNGIGMLFTTDCISVEEMMWHAGDLEILVGSTEHLLDRVVRWTCKDERNNVRKIIVECGNEKSRVAFCSHGKSQSVEARFTATGDQSWPILSAGFRLADRELVVEGLLYVLERHVDIRDGQQRQDWWEEFHRSSFDIVRLRDILPSR